MNTLISRGFIPMAILLISSCTVAPGCYVGMSIIPPGPFVHCGLDASPDDEEDE